MLAEKPDVFLCHNSADKQWVRQLGERLEVESIDGQSASRRIRVFFDEWDIERGENIVMRLGEELASGAYVAVIMSPEFFSSDWTRFEWTDVVARDPANRGGRILPVRLRDVSLDGTRRLALPPPFNALRHFDFRSPAKFEAEFEDLLRRIRNQPLPRGRSLLPRYSAISSGRPSEPHTVEAAEAVSEVLISNLAPFLDIPPSIYVAGTSIASLSELPIDAGLDGISLSLWNGKLVTFADLEDPECPLNSVIDPYAIERFEYHQCVGDEKMINVWLALANKCLAASLRRKRVSQDEKGRFYFLPSPDGKDRTITIGNYQPREVAARKRHHVTGEDFWVHYSASMKFRIVGGVAFLRVLPSYSFTHDGVVALGRKAAGRFRVIWGGKQDSATVLRQILFWLRFISDGHEELNLDTGGPPLRISAMPATAETQVGIELDHIQIKALVDDFTADELTAIVDTAELEDAEEPLEATAETFEEEDDETP